MIPSSGKMFDQESECNSLCLTFYLIQIVSDEGESIWDCSELNLVGAVIGIDSGGNLPTAPANKMDCNGVG